MQGPVERLRSYFPKLRAAVLRCQHVLWRGAAAVGVGILGILLILVLWRVPEQHVAAVTYNGPSAAHDRMQDENATRATLAQIIGGGVLLIGLYFTARNVQIAQRNVHAVEEGKITDRFSKAVEQLGSERLEIRLGGIYALERVARDSAPDHWPVMEVLTTYIGEHAPSLAPSKSARAKDGRPNADIQAILTVIGRRHRTFGHGEEQSLDLHATNLQGANLYKSQLQGIDLSGARLVGARLVGARLNRADLFGADLSRASLSRADLYEADLSKADLSEARLVGARLVGAKLVEATLSGAYLSGADLSKADLYGANLVGADLFVADLYGADLYGADLSGANLREANLRGANNLTMEQLQCAFTNEATKLPDHLLTPAPDPESAPSAEPHSN